MPQIIHRISAVLKMRGRSRSAHYLDIQQGLFPPPIKIGERAVGHPDSEIAAVNDARVAGRSNDEIRQLVADLIARRRAKQKGK